MRTVSRRSVLAAAPAAFSAASGASNKVVLALIRRRRPLLIVTSPDGTWNSKFTVLVRPGPTPPAPDQRQDNFVTGAQAAENAAGAAAKTLRLLTVLMLSNTSFKPNWISRGEVAPEMTPNCELFSVPFGLLKLG